MTEHHGAPVEGDLLAGLAAIAAHLGVEYRQAETMHRTGRIPTFKQGKTVCARKSTLAEHFRQQEARGRAQAGG